MPIPVSLIRICSQASPTSPETVTRPPAGVNEFLGTSAEIRVASNRLPDWWALGEGGCRSGSLTADFRFTTGACTDFYARVEAFLLDYPTNIGALWMKALFLEQSGEITGALQTVLAAQELFSIQNPNAGEPPAAAKRAGWASVDAVICMSVTAGRVPRKDCAGERVRRLPRASGRVSCWYG